MPVKRGRLKPEDDYKITSNYLYLKDNFDPADGILDYLISEFVFDQHDNDTVRNGGENTAYGRVERFLQILQNSGPDAYQHFIKGLNDRGDGHIANKLEKTDVPAQCTKDKLAWIDELPDSVRNQCPTAADASRLSAVFGMGWDHVFLELGITKAKIEQAKMDAPNNNSTAITNLIIQWRQRNGSRACFSLLLDAMRRAKDRSTIEWESVEKLFKEKC